MLRIALLLSLAATTPSDADRLFDAKKFAEAGAAYRELAQAEPSNPRFAARLAESWLAARRWTEAEAAYQTAIALAPSSPALRAGLGQALLEQGKAFDAADQFIAALRMNPGDRDIQRLLARAFQLGRRYDFAERILQTLIRQNPSDAVTWRQLGILFQQQGYYQSALTAFDKALALDAADKPSRAGKAVALVFLSRIEEAEPLCAALIQDPDAAADLDLRLAYAQLLFETGRLPEASRQIDAALKLQPEQPMALYWRARLLFSESKFSEAAKAGEASVKAAPELPFARGLLVRVYTAMGRPNDAAAHARWLREFDAQKSK